MSSPRRPGARFEVVEPSAAQILFRLRLVRQQRTAGQGEHTDTLIGSAFEGVPLLATPRSPSLSLRQAGTDPLSTAGSALLGASSRLSRP